MKFRLFLLAVFLISQRADAQVETSDWDIKKLSTGESVSYLSSLDKQVLLELNKVRSNPRQYAEQYIVPIVGYFKGKIDTRDNVATSEGVDAVKECIAFLKNTRSMTVLEPDPGLSKAARRHTSAQSKTTETGHDSPDGETFEHRLRKTKFSGTGECISYGESEAQGIVIQLLIDDGVPSRGHRKIILDPKYTHAGPATGGHKAYGNMCTIDFGGGKR